MAKNTRRPCPNCNEPQNRLAGQPWSPVCYRCERYIEMGRAAETAMKTTKSEDYNIPTGGHWPIHYTSNDQDEHQAVQSLRVSLEQMLTTALPASVDQGGYGGDVHHYLPEFDSHNNFHRVRISSALAKKINHFNAALNDCIQLEYNTGVADGKNLLKQLALGEISSSEFDSVER